MADTGEGSSAGGAADPTPPAGRRRAGLGVVIAATGVGVGDLALTLIAGSRYGYTLLWAVVAGLVARFVLAEAIGRWHLATGRSLFEGWRDLGPWPTGFFAVYAVLWGLLYGAAATSVGALPLVALFPGVLGLTAWAVLIAAAGLVCVLLRRHALVARAGSVLAGAMFVLVLCLAVRVGPDAGAAARGLLPTLPGGSPLYALALVGGVGGSLTLAAYGYRVRARYRPGGAGTRAMRLDEGLTRLVTGVFAVAMLVLGAELLHAAHLALARGDGGPAGVRDVLEQRFGTVTAALVLVGFLAAAFSSLVAVWHGAALLVADFVWRWVGVQFKASTVDRPGTAVPVEVLARSVPYRVYLLWLALPPVGLLFLDRPLALVVAHGVLSAVFLPFLALTTLRLLGARRTPAPWRNGWLGSCLLAAAGSAVLVPAVVELVDLLR